MKKFQVIFAILIGLGVAIFIFKTIEKREKKSVSQAKTTSPPTKKLSPEKTEAFSKKQTEIKVHDSKVEKTLKQKQQKTVQNPPVKRACNLEALYLGFGQTDQLIRKFLYGDDKCTETNNHKPDFHKALQAMWIYKVGYVKRKSRKCRKAKTGQDFDVTCPINQAKRFRLAEYEAEPNYSSLKAFMASAEQIAQATYNGIDWKMLSDNFGFKGKKARLFKQAAKKFAGGKELVAYGMTELFPSHDGNWNCRLLDYLLRNAGVNFVMAIPALYDTYSSFGLYQFTSLALRRTKDGKAGASNINNYLPTDLRIPDSVNKLTGDNHHRAAYLFAIYNMAFLIKGLNDKQVAKLTKYLAENKEHSVKLIQFIATAHHSPRNAIRSAKRWLNEDTANSFTSHCDKNIRNYSIKTERNFLALSNEIWH